jgi:hypothetical protein
MVGDEKLILSLSQSFLSLSDLDLDNYETSRPNKKTKTINEKPRNRPPLPPSPRNQTIIHTKLPCSGIVRDLLSGPKINRAVLRGALLARRAQVGVGVGGGSV